MEVEDLWIRMWSGAFYMCGEYGPEGGRPHYHANLFGEDFREEWKPLGKSSSGSLFYESETLTKLWSHGRATVQPLTRETAGYTARYIMKKVLGPHSEFAYSVTDEDGEIRLLKPEYAAMSLKPGIGARWFAKYGKTDVFPHDVAVAGGQEYKVPKYYDKLAKRGVEFTDDVEFQRYLRGREALPDNTDERRLVREKVHEAKVQSLKRGLE